VPRALAIETSGRVGSIALWADGAIVSEATFPYGLRNAAAIQTIIQSQCQSAGWKPADVDHVYVSAGPGSFTGLRIGITLAKTLAFSLGLKVVAVPTVRALAANAPQEARHVIIVLDAKRQQVYAARFERQGAQWIEREPAQLADLAAILARSPRPVWLLGEGIAYHRQAIAAGGEGVVVAPQELWRARAGAVAEIGAEMAAAGQFADPYTLVPQYIRRPEAEEKWEARGRDQG